MGTAILTLCGRKKAIRIQSTNDALSLAVSENLEFT